MLPGTEEVREWRASIVFYGDWSNNVPSFYYNLYWCFHHKMFIASIVLNVYIIILFTSCNGLYAMRLWSCFIYYGVKNVFYLKHASQISKRYDNTKINIEVSLHFMLTLFIRHWKSMGWCTKDITPVRYKMVPVLFCTYCFMYIGKWNEKENWYVVASKPIM